MFNWGYKVRNKSRLCNIRVIVSKDRLEIYKYSNYSFKKGEKNNTNGRKGNGDLSQEQKKENTKHNRKATLTEARNDIIRLIKCNDDMRTFITLTYAVDREYQESKKDLRKFFRKLNDKYKGLKYLWVLELTKRNRVHYHILCNIDFGITHFEGKRKSKKHKKIERDIAAEYWKNGFIDIRSLGAEGNTNIALYVSAYLVKDLLDKEDLKGQRVYGYSYRTMNKPIEYCYWTNMELEEFIKGICEDYQLIFTNSYDIGIEGKVNYFDLKEKQSGN